MSDQNQRRDWYRQAIASDPERRERFVRMVEDADPGASVPDDPAEIERLLGGRGE